MTATHHDSDLINVIIADHREVQRCFDELESGTGTPQQRRDLADHVITELVRHSVAEEQHMYPMVRKTLPGGDELSDHEIAEHEKAEQEMKELEDLEPTNPRFDEMIAKLIKDVRHHIQEEEQDLLPRLRAACEEDELQQLGEKVLKAKESAPTRPHPNAPQTPPANLILAPGLGLIDKVRDHLTGRSH